MNKMKMLSVACCLTLCCFTARTACANENLALGADASASDNGWGGATSKSDLTDGFRSYPEWQHGLAAPFGASFFQMTLDFGQIIEFNQVVAWWHPDEVRGPKNLAIMIWNNNQWETVYSTIDGLALMGESDHENGYGSRSQIFDFDSVSSDKVMIFYDNAEILTRAGQHGWAYEVEVFNVSTNASPIANAGVDQTLSCESPVGALVTLDATGSSDPDGDALTFEWSVPAGVLLDDPASGTPSGYFPVGVTTATLTVTDGNGGLDVDDVVITVIDQTPPEVSVTTDIGAIWPPNHDMIPVTVYVDATDHCTAPENLILGLVTIQSNEPDDADGLGDGETTGDVDGQDGYTSPVDVTSRLVYNPATASFEGVVLLRAERNGNGFGRTYTITATVLDTSENVVESSCVVVVPHNRRKK